MVKCDCGRVIEKIPSWLATVKVDFVCNNCPNRQVKPISQLHAEQQAAAAKAAAEEKAASDALGMDEPDLDDEDED
ncbi:MAG: hypothetical protein JNK63_10820 [Chthonomonas sp.]|nr:hypothetical protein [Chthonomonas sp.]